MFLHLVTLHKENYQRAYQEHCNRESDKDEVVQKVKQVEILLEDP